MIKVRFAIKILGKTSKRVRLKTVALVVGFANLDSQVTSFNFDAMQNLVFETKF